MASGAASVQSLPTPDDIARTLEPYLKEMPPVVQQALHENAVSTLASVFRGPLELTLTVVVDTNKAVEACFGKAKHGHALLIELARYPFVKLLAPRDLDVEVREKIPAKAAGAKVDPEIALAVWESSLRPRIVVMPDMKDEYWAEAEKALLERDSKDVPFLAVYLRSGARAILTGDKDVASVPGAHVWETKDLGRMAAVLRRGTFAFFIVHPVMTTTAAAILLALAAVLKALAEAAWALIKATGRGIEGIIDWFKGLSTEDKVLAAIVTAIGGIAAAILIYAFWDQICGLLRKMAAALRAFVAKLVEQIKELVKALEPFLEVAAAGLVYVAVCVGEMLVVAAVDIERQTGFAPEDFGPADVVS